jgi:hypothetical protein
VGLTAPLTRNTKGLQISVCNPFYTKNIFNTHTKGTQFQPELCYG